MKTLENYINILNFIKEYINEHKFDESNSAELRNDLAYSEGQIDSIVSLIQSIMVLSKLLNFFSTLE